MGGNIFSKESKQFKLSSMPTYDIINRLRQYTFEQMLKENEGILEGQQQQKKFSEFKQETLSTDLYEKISILPDYINMEIPEQFKFCMSGTKSSSEVLDVIHDIRQALMQKYDYNGDPYKMVNENFSFRALGLLGEGIQSIVIKAQQVNSNKNNNRQLVYKVIRLNRNNLMNLAIELDIMSFLTFKQPEKFCNLLAFQIDGLDDESMMDLTCRIILEYDGCDLMTLEKFRTEENRKFTLEEVLYILMQSLECLQFLQSFNLFFMDVKPENIIITRDNKVKLLNFGMINYSSLLNKNTNEVNVQCCGTIRYMSPEMLKLNPETGDTSQSFKCSSINQVKIDIYSLGLTILQMLNPSCNNRQGLIECMSQLEETKRFNELLPLIRDMIKENPHERPQLKEFVQFVSKQFGVQPQLLDQQTYQKLIKEQVLICPSKKSSNILNIVEIQSMVRRFIELQQYDSALFLTNQIMQEISNSDSFPLQSMLVMKYEVLTSILRLDQSGTFLQNKLKEYEQRFGSDTLEVANSLNNLGYFNYFSENYEGAFDCLQRSLKIFKERLPEDHVDIISTYIMLGVLYEKTKQFEAAIDFYLKALPIVEKKVKKINLFTAGLYNALSRTYDALGDTGLAMKFANKAKSIDEKKLGQDDQQTKEAVSYLHELKSKVQ